MKNTVKLSILCGLLFGTFMGAFWLLLGMFFMSPGTSLVNAIYQGVFCGVFFGIFFPIGMKFFVKYQSRKFQEENESWLQGMTVLYSDSANHFMGVEGVGGHLILTPDVLIFKSHKYNIQNHSLEIPLEQCVNITTINYCYLVPKGMQIETTGGKTEKFVVNNRKFWIEKIRDAISQKKDQQQNTTR